MILRVKVLLLLCILLVLINSESRAEETSYASYSPMVYVVTGLLIVDVGASISNGFSLSRGKPNRINGYFGLVTGAVSLGLVAVTFAMEDDEDLRNGFALTMGTAGTASLVLGAMNILRSRQSNTEISKSPGVMVFPSLSEDKDQRYRIGVNAVITF